MITELTKERIKLELSEMLNNKGIYNRIKDIALHEFNIEIDADSTFWNELEDEIIEKIIEKKPIELTTDLLEKKTKLKSYYCCGGKY